MKNRNFFFLTLSFFCIDIFGYNNITILTAPIGKDSNQSGGPSQVTRSLIEGLKKISIHFNYNPRCEKDIYEVVVVLSDNNALKQAIALKKQKKIKKLLAGPNLVIRSNENNGLIASPEIDICIVPSEWVKPAYIEDEPSLNNRIQTWFAGVDIDYWCPHNSLEKKVENRVKDVLVYWKTENEIFCSQVEQMLRQCGWNPIRLQYGTYTKEYYKKILSQVVFAVFISRSESQGIAMAESWAMDVPTLVWDPQEPLKICNKMYWPISACPYLDQKNGIFWKNISEMEQLLNSFSDTIKSFSPRTWVLSHMSDEISASLLWKIVNS